MTKKDTLLIICLLCIAGVLTLILHFRSAPGNKVSIQVNGVEHGIYRLNENAAIRVPGHGSDSDYNIVNIKDGHVSVTGATCPDSTCMGHPKISRSGESIICVPNRVVVEIIGGREQGTYPKLPTNQDVPYGIAGGVYAR